MLRQGLAMIMLVLFAAAGQAQDATEGRGLYRNHCATCHGIDATGHGPMVGVMIIKPTDLTLLAATNNGSFPIARVVARIDGRDPLVSHGSPMPVYGDFFEGVDKAVKTATGQPILTSEPIIDLLAYLESIQKN